jgi:signal transduction histidine kinase
VYYDQRASWNGLTGWVLRNGTPLFINDIRDPGNLPPNVELIYVGEAHPLSLVTVPLSIGEQVIGALSVQSEKANAYTQHDLNFLTAIASQVAIAVENARLYEREQKRATQASLLNVIARQTNTTLSPEQLLSELTTAIQQHFDYESINVMLYDPKSENLFLAGKAGPAAGIFTDDYRQSPDIGIIGWVFTHGEPLLVNDTSQDERYFSPVPESYVAASELAFPLKIGGRTIGVLDLQRTEPHGFDQLDVATAQTMTEQVALALQNARLYGEIRRRAEELTALNTVAGRLGQSLELQEVLDAATEEVTRVLNMEASAISLIDESEDTLVLYAQRGLRFSHVGMTVPLGKGLSGQVIHSGKTLIAGDVSQDPRLAVRNFAREQVQAMALVPMHSRGKVVGILSAMSYVPHDFNRQEIALLEAIANQVGTSAENARLFQEVKEHVVNLEEAYARLQELDNMKDEMIQNISHEMRTPLTFVKGYVQLLLDEQLGELTDMQQASLEIVDRKTEQLARLIGDIITLQTLTEKTLRVQITDLAEIARQAIGVWQSEASSSGIALEEVISDNIPLALADPDHVRQVFDHLLSNAIKFSLDEGMITVRITAAEGWLVTEVSDTGIGIPPDQLSRIFDRFYQVDGSAERRFGGAGLGLSVVKLIVESHGGMVFVQSRLGEGSVFSFTLPQAHSNNLQPFHLPQ